MFVCLGAAAVLIGMYLVREHMGRRITMVSGSIACGLAMMIIGIAGQLQTKENKHAVGKALIASTAIFIFFYNASVGMISYPIGAEVVSSKLRAWTLGTAISLGYLLAWLVGFCSPYFINPNKLNWVCANLPPPRNQSNLIEGCEIWVDLDWIQLYRCHIFLSLLTRDQEPLFGRNRRVIRESGERERFRYVSYKDCRESFEGRARIGGGKRKYWDGD